MKMKLCVLIFLLATALAQAQTNNLTALLQQGLFEEQANQNLEAAIASYQTLARQFDKDRQLAATAVFRIGECYRMQGKTNEAAVQYERILKDFSDQATLATLSRQNLTGMGTSATMPKANDNADANLWSRLEQLDKADVEKVLPTLVSDSVLDNLLRQRNEAQAKVAQLLVDYSPEYPEVQRQKALVDETNRQIAEKISGIMQGLKMRAEISKAGSTLSGNQPPNGAATDEEEQEIRHIQQMIQNSPDLINALDNTQTRRGYTPLVWAAYSGWLKVAAYLLEHGADINVGGGAALNGATRSGNRAMVEFLLSHGANVNSKDESNDWGTRGQTALHIAVSKKFQAVTEVLLANKADVNIQDSNGNTPLRLAAINGQIKIIKMLLAAAANPNIQNETGKTPLSAVAGSGSPEMTKLLLDAGAKSNIENDNGQTPLSVAAESGSPETVKLLLAAKADPNGGTLGAPLLAAINAKDTNSAELLLQAGANPNVLGKVNWDVFKNGGTHWAAGQPIETPLFLAVFTKQFPMVQLLLKYKADPNDLQTDGRSLLFSALSDTNILEALLTAGAKVDPTTTDEANWTPLAAAVSQKNVSAVEVLLKHGADPNIHNSNGATPLYWAAGRLADTNIFRLLLDYKANPNVRASNGETPLESLKLWPTRDSRFATPEQKVLAGQLADFLRQRGALDKLPDWDRITVSRPSANFSQVVFQKGINDWNQFTLLETIFNQYKDYKPNSTPFPSILFPDLARIVILRANHGTTNLTRIAVNLLNSTNGVNYSKDVPLEFGDVVEIPEREHALGERAVGLTDNQMGAILGCLQGNIQLVVRDQKVELVINPYPFNSLVGSVIQQGKARNALLSSSDLSRVKVVRRDAKTGKTHEWIVDCSNPNAAPDLWLRNGDVVEVPEKP